MSTFDIASMGQGLASEAANGILGMALGSWNDKRQIKQQQQLTNMQLTAQKNMTDYQMMKQLQMWKDTSYPAQMEMLKKAGLNPGLIYGMGGGGGQTVGGGAAGVEGAHAVQNPGEVQGIMGIGLQGALLQAQIENIKADTKKKLTEVPNVEAGTGKIIAETGNVTMDTYLKSLEAKMQSMQNEVMKGTIEEQIMTITNKATTAMEEAMQMGVKTNIDRATMNNVIDTVGQNLANMIVEKALKEAEIAKTVQDTEATKQAILQKWTELEQRNIGLDIQEQEKNIHAFDVEMKSAYPSLWGVMGNSLQTLTRVIDKRRPTYQIPGVKMK